MFGIHGICPVAHVGPMLGDDGEDPLPGATMAVAILFNASRSIDLISSECTGEARKNAAQSCSAS